MRKGWVVFKREFLQNTRKKSFWILTVLMPFLMAALFVVPALLTGRGFQAKKIVVLDGTRRLADAFQRAPAGSPGTGRAGRGGRPAVRTLEPEYVAVQGDPQEAAKPYLERLGQKGEKRLDGVVVIPSRLFDDPKASLVYYSRSASDLVGQGEVGRIVGDAVSKRRLSERGIEPAVIEQVLRQVPVEAIQVSAGGQQKKGGKGSFLLGFFFAIFLFIPAISYGVEIMRGISEEKTDRIVEILISSMSPLQLLSGKVLGLAAAGLTQVLIWMGMTATAVMVGRGMAAASGDISLDLLRPSLIPAFLAFFMLGYLLYVAVYAVGGSIANSEKEAQQITAPVMLILMVPWILVGPIVLDPESKLAVTLSLIPVFAPITMFVRILLSDPPFWQVLLSIALSAVTVWGMFWVAAKIFRVGILSYGKRPTIPELWRWLKVA